MPNKEQLSATERDRIARMAKRHRTRHRGISQEAAAREIGMPLATYSKIERGLSCGFKARAAIESWVRKERDIKDVTA